MLACFQIALTGSPNQRLLSEASDVVCGDRERRQRIACFIGVWEAFDSVVGSMYVRRNQRLWRPPYHRVRNVRRFRRHRHLTAIDQTKPERALARRNYAP